MPKKQKGSGGVFSSSAKVTPAEKALKQAQEQIKKNIKTIKTAKRESKHAVSQASVRPTSSKRQAFSPFEAAAEKELKELEKSIRGSGMGSSKPSQKIVPVSSSRPPIDTKQLTDYMTKLRALQAKLANSNQTEKDKIRKLMSKYSSKIQSMTTSRRG